MGRFTYESTTRIDFNDRLLAHLQAVIYTRLRHADGFFFTWREDASTGGNRSSVWIHKQSALVFTFTGSGPLLVNRSWINALAATANSAAGLYVVREPLEEATEPDRVAAPV
jgi:hypothetical protein